MDLLLSTTNPTVLVAPEEPEFKYEFATYALEGHYLIRYQENGRWVSKFVTAEDMSAAYTLTEKDTGWIPNRIMRFGSSPRGPWSVYSTEPREILITLEGDLAPISIPAPRLVLLGIGNTYYLWALKCEDFQRDGVAYKAPFPNVHDDGKICWGSNTPPAATVDKIKDAWKLFFATPFNNHLTNGKSIKYPNDVREMLRDLAIQEKYPVSDLRDASGQGRTISSVIESVLTGKGY